MKTSKSPVQSILFLDPVRNLSKNTSFTLHFGPQNTTSKYTFGRPSWTK